MRQVVCAICLLLLFATTDAALARPVNIPTGAPVLGIDIPDGWKTTATKRGLEVRSPDEEVFFWVEVYPAADDAAVTAEHDRYFTRQGVLVTGEPRTSRTEAAGVKIQAIAFPATWKGKPTVLRYVRIDPGLPGAQQVQISLWASPEGDKTHDAAFVKVLDSLGPPK